jgi:hypothetical protein
MVRVMLCLAKIPSGHKRVSHTKLRDLICIEPLAGKRSIGDAEDRERSAAANAMVGEHTSPRFSDQHLNDVRNESSGGEVVAMM